MVRWLPSLNHLEQLNTPDTRIRANDLVIRSFRTSGDVDPARWRHAIKILQRRHEILTARIVMESDGTYLYPGEDVWNLELLSPTGCGQDGSWPLLDKELSDVLPDGACVRLSLKAGPGSTTILLLAANHSIMDARSISILVRDLLFAMDGNSRIGEQASSSRNSESFGVWTGWERAYVASKYSTLMEFWRKKLDSIGPFPEVGLPQLADKRREGISPTVFNLKIGAPANAVVADLAAKNDTSEFVVVSLLMKVTLLALRTMTSSGASASVAAFGAFPNRLPRWAGELVGGFANSVIIVSELNVGDSLSSAVRREANEIFRASCYQSMPHSLLVAALDPGKYGVRYRSSLDEMPRYFNFDMPLAAGATLQSVDGVEVSEVASPWSELPRSGFRVVARAESWGWSLEARYDPHVYDKQIMQLLEALWHAITTIWLQASSLLMGDVLSIAARSCLPTI